MIRAFVRSFTFNIAFYIYTAACCLVLVFAFLLPRKAAFTFVQMLYFRGIAWVERIFLGLDYRVEGRENLPREGSYILAVKHYSTYETLKMPVIFGDIAIILKRELTWIPFWGWYTIKTGMIPVDRGGRHKALESLIRGGRRVVAQGRPILIFPQGTRVAATDTPATKPYKIGGARIAEALNLPIVPVACNSGAFWPKHSFMKKTGIVDFRVLPAIPAGLPATEALARLEDVLERESNALMQAPAYGAHTRATRLWGLRPLLRLALVLAALWCVWWPIAAHGVRVELDAQQAAILTASPEPAKISGFPGPLRIEWRVASYNTPEMQITAPLVRACFWPLPGASLRITAPEGARLLARHAGRTVDFMVQDFSLGARLPLFAPSISLRSLDLASGDSRLAALGDIAVPLNGQPVNGKIEAALFGYDAFLDRLVQDGLVRAQSARMARSILGAMAAAQDDGSVHVPAAVHDDVVYVSVVRLFSLADWRRPADESGMPPQKIRSGD